MKHRQNNQLMATVVAVGSAIGIAAAYLFASNSVKIKNNREPRCSSCGRKAADCRCPESSSLNNPLYLGAACALLGAGTALLFAPKSGKDLREDISDIVDTVSARTQEFASDLEERGEEVYQNMKSGGNEIYNRAKKVVQSFNDKVEEEVEKPLIHKLEDAMRVVQSGLRLWNSFADKR